MTITRQEDTLHVSDLAQLTAADVAAFGSAIAASLDPGVRHVELNLSRTEEIDCAGLGALIALRKTLAQRHPQGTLSLRDPAPPVQRLLELTRADRLFSLPASDYALAEALPHF